MATIRLGKDVLIKIDLNGVGGAGANWAAIAQQTDGKLDVKTDKIDTTVKGDNGWTKELPVAQGWTITCEGKADPADSTYAMLWAAQIAGTKVYWRLCRGDIAGTSYEGTAYVSFGESYPLKDAVGFSLELSCQGKPTVSTPLASPSASKSASPSASPSASVSAS